MAMLSDLVRTVAEATGDPESTVTVVARSLREAGLIATGGRGRSGAKMSPRDAASLLLGVGSPGDNTKAAETVRLVGELKLEPFGELPNRPSGLSLKKHGDELGLVPGQSLHDCLSSLLERIASPPTAVAPQLAPRAKDLFEAAPFQFTGDTWPRAVALEVVRNAHGLRAQLSLWLRGGDSVVLKFSLNGATMLKEELDGSLTEDPRGKHSSISLLSTVAAKVVACLAGESSNGDDDDRKTKG